ncbi:MAG: alpha/beta hydrolase [Chloroflexota bacterium]
MENIEKQFINLGQVTLHVVTAGDKDGEPVVLLHGFPEFWYGWRKQIPFLVEKGYRVIVPDQRGYNLSDKPTGRANYTLDILAQDAAKLIEALGYDKVNLVGHDWGGVISWVIAAQYRDKLKKLVVLNAPSASVVTQEFLNGNLEHMLRMSYQGFFNLPIIPEVLISLNDYKTFGKGLQANATQGAFSDEDIEQYRRAWAQPNAMTSMLNYYRANSNLSGFTKLSKKQHITTPTLMLWGEKDSALVKEMAQPSMDLVEDGELVFFPHATHFIQHDAPDSVNEEIYNFISKPIAEPVV